MKHVRIASGALALLLATACVTPGVTAKAATAGQEAIMQQWVQEGLLTGYEDGSLQPDATVTRAEFVHLMVKLGFTGTGSTANYTDVETAAWYYSDIMSASAAGYVSGRANGSFGPRDTITRQEGIAMVARALNLADDYVTGSGENCSDWFAGEVGAIIGAGLYASGTDFTADLSRAETVALLNSVRGKQTTTDGVVSSGLAGVSGTGLGTTEGVSTVTGSDVTVTKKSDTVSGTVANVTISSKLGSTSYTLDDVTITGDLIIESTGNITLDDVTVKGKIIVEGSGATVILKKNADVGDVVFHDSGSITGSTYKGTLGTVTVDTDSKYDSVTLSVKADTVNVDDQCYLYIEKNVATLNVNSGAKNAIIGIDYSAKVTEANVDAAIDLYGRGDIGTLYLNASNCTISRGLDISKTTKASGVKGTSYTYDDWYWYNDGWCPIHEKWDDGCWYDGYWYGWEYGYGPDGYWYGDPDGVPPEGFGPGGAGEWGGAINNGTKSVEAASTITLTSNAPSGVVSSVKWVVSTSDSAYVELVGGVTGNSVDVRGLKAGTATVSLTDANSGRTLEKWTVNVTDTYTLSLVEKTAAVAVDGTTQLTATVTGKAGATLSNATITWGSDAPAVATVDSSGLVTGMTSGSATITATYDGKTQSCTVTVSSKS